MDIGGFGRHQYEDPPHLVEPNHSKEWVRFDGEADPGELCFSVRSRTRNVRYTVAIKTQGNEDERGEAICGCPWAMCNRNPERPLVTGHVCWHVSKVLSEAKKIAKRMK